MGKIRAEEIGFNFLFNTIFLWQFVACLYIYTLERGRTITLVFEGVFSEIIRI